MPYAPRAAMRALRHFLGAYGGRLWGRYGLVDAFSETRNWYADTFLAIDQGPIILMIENYRTGLLWKLFMGVPEVQAGLRKPSASPARICTDGLKLMEPLDLWVDRQYRHAATRCRRAYRPLGVVKTRPGFGQTHGAEARLDRRLPGSGRLRSGPRLFLPLVSRFRGGDRCLRLLTEDGSAAADAMAQFSDFVHFSLALQGLDGRELVAAPAWRTRVAPDFKKFLRSDADLASAHGEAIAGETGSIPTARSTFPAGRGRSMTALRCGP
jgi:hypothetical protein